MIPGRGPSCMKALIQEMQVCYDLYEEDHEQAKRSGSKNPALQQEVYGLLGSTESKC